MNSNVARNAMVGVIAALIATLLVASGFLVRMIVEPADELPAAAATPEPGTSASGDGQVDYDILAEIVDVLEQDYVEQGRVNEELLFEGAINGLFNALGDPHSTYIDPETYSISQNDFEGAFQGIGATVAQEGEHVIIVRPLPDTPAERAGIQAGDIILEVNGESAVGWSVTEAVLKIRGPQGTEVELLIQHSDGSEERVTIVRDEIQVASVRTEPPGGVLEDADGNQVNDIGYIWIRSFTRLTPQELADAVTAAEENGAHGLILDVRSNPGGLLVETTQVADMFLDDGVIFSQVDQSGNQQSATARPGQVTNLPIVVLQDEFSASGAELLAAALQENGRATVVGAPSFGKGTVNHAVRLSNGGAVYVSIARWLSPDGHQIEGRGIEPDVPVELTLEDVEAQRDVALHRSIEVLRQEIDRIAARRAATPAATAAAAP